MKETSAVILLLSLILSTFLLGSAAQVDAVLNDDKKDILQEPKQQLEQLQENGRTLPAQDGSTRAASDPFCDAADNTSAAEPSSLDKVVNGRVGHQHSPNKKDRSSDGGHNDNDYEGEIGDFSDGDEGEDERDGDDEEEDDDEDVAAAEQVNKQDGEQDGEQENDGDAEEDEEDEEEDEEDEEEDKEEDEEEDDGDKVVDAEYSATFREFVVAGINLADDNSDTLNLAVVDNEQPRFELYKDFDISEYIKGQENWEELLAYRNKLERPSLSFYVDKVARKRWLPTQGYNQPKLHALFYASELKATDFSGQVEEIKKLLPVNYSYAAKPTHKSMSLGTWLVDHNGDDATTRFTTKAAELTDEDGTFNATACAASLAQGLHEKCDDWESWALKNVRPGFVVEERWSSYENRNDSPHEFNLLTLWGRLWTGQWNFIRGQSRYWYAFVHRNGTVALTSPAFREPRIPDWIPWDELVRLAEELGTHKDMFRTDIFIGRPANSHDSSNSDGSSARPSLEIAVSECEIFPTTIFESEAFTDEGARLWKAGYQMGIYDVIENDEVPREFLETGMLSAQS
ncbi:hypothetical protein ACA910_006644 [Epithemia clementina (nom. ined.)]